MWYKQLTLQLNFACQDQIEWSPSEIKVSGKTFGSFTCEQVFWVGEVRELGKLDAVENFAPLFRICLQQVRRYLEVAVYKNFCIRASHYQLPNQHPACKLAAASHVAPQHDTPPVMPTSKCVLVGTQYSIVEEEDRGRAREKGRERAREK